jgi:hypothetical protein
MLLAVPSFSTGLLVSPEFYACGIRLLPGPYIKGLKRWAGSIKTQQWPPTLGVGIVFGPWKDAGPVDLGMKFVKNVLGYGVI